MKCFSPFSHAVGQIIFVVIDPNNLVSSEIKCRRLAGHGWGWTECHILTLAVAKKHKKLSSKQGKTEGM